MKITLFLICMFLCGADVKACDEDDRTDYVPWLDVMPVGKSEWKFIRDRDR